MAPNELKEVYYCDYCDTCKHRDVEETEEPCNECLTTPVNLWSHKPIKYEASDNE